MSRLILALKSAIVFALLSAGLSYGSRVGNVSMLSVGNGAEPDSLSPWQFQSLSSYNIIKNLFEGLVYVDSKGTLYPAQAESWDVSPDGKTLTFHLRQGLRWSNGDPLTASDFVYALQYAVTPESAQVRSYILVSVLLKNASAILAGTKEPSTLGVEAPDRHTLIFVLEKPVAYALRILGRDSFPLHKKTVEKHGKQWVRPENLVSNGPYRLTGWVINEYVQLNINNQYWNKNALDIQTVRFFPVSVESELNRYLAGDLHITYSLPVDQKTRIFKQHPDEIKAHPFFATHMYSFNTTIKRFASKDVRKALSYAIDRKLLTEKVLNQMGTPAYWFTPPQGIDFSPPAVPLSVLDDHERIEKAKWFYQQAGFSEKNPLSVEILYNTSEQHKRVALAVAAMWKQHLNVSVTLSNKEFNSLASDMTTGRFEIARLGMTFMDPEPCLVLELFTGKHPFNYSRYQSSKYDVVYEQAAASMSPESRWRMFQKAEQLLAEDMPAIPLFSQIYTRLVKPVVGGYPMQSEPPDFYIKDLFFK